MTIDEQDFASAVAAYDPSTDVPNPFDQNPVDANPYWLGGGDSNGIPLLSPNTPAPSVAVPQGGPTPPTSAGGGGDLSNLPNPYTGTAPADMGGGFRPDG